MTDVLVQNAVIQVIHSGSGGGVSRLSNATVQAIITSIAGYTKVSNASVQVITTATAQFVQLDNASVQVIHQGSGGGTQGLTESSVQVIYTIGVSDIIRQRAWTFDFDGHTFYCLDIGADGTLVFDVTTGQWSRFDTQGQEGHWVMKNGFHWRTGNKVVAGAMDTPIILQLDPTSFLDEGWRPVVYEVRGIIFATDVSYHRNYALRLLGSAGRNADTVAPTLSMQYSDDQGQTWSTEQTVTLTSDTRERIEFRSLGAFTAPGRIFRLYDTGGIKFIAYATAEVEGAED